MANTEDFMANSCETRYITIKKTAIIKTWVKNTNGVR